MNLERCMKNKCQNCKKKARCFKEEMFYQERNNTLNKMVDDFIEEMREEQNSIK